MRSFPRFALAFLLTLQALLGVATASAQASIASIDVSRLVSHYTSLERNPQSQTARQRIDQERSRIRSAIDDQVNSFINEFVSAASDAESTSVTRAQERQRALVQALQSKLDETRADHELVQREESFYTEEDQPAAASGSGIRLTSSYPEYQAKLAVLEERLASLEFFLQLHQERLQQLTLQQQFERFALVIGVAQYIAVLLVIIVVERLIRAHILSQIKNRNQRYVASKLFSFFVYGFIILWIVMRVSAENPGIVTSFAIVGAGVAVALQDVIKDLVGWVIILQRRPFSLGHRVTIGDITGDVIDIGPFRTTLLEISPATSTIEDVTRSGKTLSVPNSYVLREPILNYNATSDFLEAQLQLTVLTESDWRRAKQIILGVLEEVTGEFSHKAQAQHVNRTHNFFFAHETYGPRVYLEINDRGVLFTLRFTVPIGQRRAVSSDIVEKVLERFSAEEPPIELGFGFTRQNPPREKTIMTDL